MRRCNVAVLVSLLVFSGWASASAQTTVAPETWTVSPMGGFAFDPDADASMTLGGALGYVIDRHLTVEADISRLFDLQPDDADVDSTLTTFHGALLYHFTRAPIAPYIGAGLGLGLFSHSVVIPPASINTAEIGFNLGGGATYELYRRMLLRGDARYFNHNDNVPTTWRFVAALTIPIS